MKIKTFIFVFIGFFSIIFTNSNMNYVVGQENVYQHDTISMEPGRTHDVFYSLKTGTAWQQIRSDWDIQFSTHVFDVTIRTNGAQGVVLYTYPNADISGWSSVDTTGLSTWPALNDSDKDWEMGAFNQNGFGDFDYGWGIYNMVTHIITGDSLYVLGLPSGTFLKLWIVQKNPVTNVYTFKFANLDGTDENEVVLNCNDYPTKNFVGYSFTTKQFVDREPASAEWDLLFTKYMTFYQNVMWYPVTGVLQNYNTEVASYAMDTTFMDFTIDALDSTTISTIGNNWFKLLGGMPPAYEVDDSLVYFVSDQESSIWKLVFEYYSSGEGKIGFRKMLVEDNSAISEIPGMATGNIAISPNPANANTQLLFTADKSGMAELNIVNLSGQMVSRRNISCIPGLNNTNIDVSNLPAGVYMVTLRSENTLLRNKLIKN
jgi:hypothetical protein